MVEMLISLAITATLLAAMGMAFTAAGSAVQMNDRYFRSVQQARTALDLLMTEIRRCQAVTAPAVPGSTRSYTSITLTAASGDFNGDSITYAYNAGNQTLTLTDNTAGTTTTLASNVTSASFTVMPGKNFSGANCISAIALTMTVEIPNNQITLSDSAAPRVNLVSLYQ
jgi:hypothetical protein